MLCYRILSIVRLSKKSMWSWVRSVPDRIKLKTNYFKFSPHEPCRDDFIILVPRFSFNFICQKFSRTFFVFFSTLVGLLRQSPSLEDFFKKENLSLFLLKFSVVFALQILFFSLLHDGGCVNTNSWTILWKNAFK